MLSGYFGDFRVGHYSDFKGIFPLKKKKYIYIYIYISLIRITKISKNR